MGGPSASDFAQRRFTHLPSVKRSTKASQVTPPSASASTGPAGMAQSGDQITVPATPASTPVVETVEDTLKSLLVLLSRFKDPSSLKTNKQLTKAAKKTVATPGSVQPKKAPKLKTQPPQQTSTKRPLQQQPCSHQKPRFKKPSFDPRPNCSRRENLLPSLKPQATPPTQTRIGPNQSPQQTFCLTRESPANQFNTTQPPQPPNHRLNGPMFLPG